MINLYELGRMTDELELVGDEASHHRDQTWGNTLDLECTKVSALLFEHVRRFEPAPRAVESAGIPPLVAPGSLTRYRRGRNPPKQSMNPIVLIPARMAATRLPGKPLADIQGAPMIVRVLRQALAAKAGPVAEGRCPA